ncbi:MAG: hypothetical protein ABEJ55_06210 [Halanaeroarchaeum sp.]
MGSHLVEELLRTDTT